MRFYTIRFEIALSFILFVLFLLLSIAVKSGVIDSFDNALLQAVQSVSNPILTWLMVSVSAFGDNFNSIFVFFAFAFALLFGGYKRESYFSFVIWIGPILSYLAKLAVARDRPFEFLIPSYSQPSDFSFPSGHVVFYTVFFGLVALYALTLPRLSRLGRSILLVISGSLISLVGLSRVYLGVHHPSDVIGGYLLGFSLLALINIVYFRYIVKKNVEEKERVRQQLKKSR